MDGVGGTWDDVGGVIRAILLRLAERVRVILNTVVSSGFLEARSE